VRRTSQFFWGLCIPFKVIISFLALTVLLTSKALSGELLVLPLSMVDELSTTLGTVNFAPIRFPPNGTNVSDLDLQRLKVLGDRLRDLPIYVFIESFTDMTGSAERNQELSQHRAQIVRDILVKQSGLSENQVLAKGYGESRAAELDQRRVQIRLLRPNDQEFSDEYYASALITRGVDYDSYAEVASTDVVEKVTLSAIPSNYMLTLATQPVYLVDLTLAERRYGALGFQFGFEVAECRGAYTCLLDFLYIEGSTANLLERYFAVCFSLGKKLIKRGFVEVDWQFGGVVSRHSSTLVESNREKKPINFIKFDNSELSLNSQADGGISGGFRIKYIKMRKSYVPFAGIGAIFSSSEVIARATLGIGFRI